MNASKKMSLMPFMSFMSFISFIYVHAFHVVLRWLRLPEGFADGFLGRFPDGFAKGLVLINNINKDINP